MSGHKGRTPINETRNGYSNGMYIITKKEILTSVDIVAK